MAPQSECEGGNSERWPDGAAGRKDTATYKVEIGQAMDFKITIDDAGFRINSHPAGA